MARYDFGGTLADFVVTSRRLGGLDVLGLSSATLTCWSAQSGGTKYTDLQLNGSSVSSITVGTDGQVPKFQGPDGVTEMWVDGGSPRVRVVTLQGAPGPAGPVGPGSTVPGPQGSTGPQGDQGLPGVNAVANDTATAGYISTTGTSATQTAADARYSKRGDLMFSVRDYGAKGDGATDDTATINAAITAAKNAGGGIVFVPRGTYIATRVLTESNVTLRGAGATSSVIKVKSGSVETKLIETSFRSNVTIEDLGLDANGSTTTKSGVYAAQSGVDKHLIVQRCRFVNFMPSSTDNTNGAVYTWNTSDVRVTDNEFVGCGRAVLLDTPSGDAVVHGNRITATAVMATGVFVKGPGGAASASKVSITNNYIDGASYDPPGLGQDGHGISCYQARDVKIIGNTCNNSGRGILVSSNSHGATVMGNVCVGNHDAGIRTEPNIVDGSTTVGTAGAVRGLVISGNVCRDNGPTTPGTNYTGIGITISYAAGAVVTGNLCHGNMADGIACDSDRVIIQGNTCHSNWRDTVNSPPTGTKAGIRLYVGVGCLVLGNNCFDNQTTKTQNYGVSLSTAGQIVANNNLTGNATGEIDYPQNIKTGFSLADFGVTPNSATDFTTTIQAAINTVRDAVKSSTSSVANNVLSIPAGRYKVSTKLDLPPYVKLRPIGQVILDWSGGNSSCLHVAPQAADPTTVFTGLGKQQEEHGPIVDGGVGGLTIRNTGVIGGTAVGLEVGARSALGGGRVMARYEIANVAITNFDIGLKLNTCDHFVGSYRRLHIEGNTTAIQVGDAGVGSVNSGENFGFYQCIVAGGTTGVLVNTFGWDATFTACSFDFLTRVATIADGYGNLKFHGGHIEGINSTKSPTDGVIVCTATSAVAGVSFVDVPMLVNVGAPWFSGSFLKVTGSVVPRAYDNDLVMPYPASVPAQTTTQPLCYGLKNNATMNRRILTLEHNRIPDPNFLNETTAAAKSSGNLAGWTATYFGGATIEVLGTNVDTPFSGGKSLKIVMPLGAGVTLTHTTAIPLRDLEERWGTAVLKSDIANPNFTVAAVVLAPDGTTIEQRADVSISGIGSLPLASWQLPRFLGVGANMPAMTRASAFKPRFLISNPSGNSGVMTVTIPFLYYGQ